MLWQCATTYALGARRHRVALGVGLGFSGLALRGWELAVSGFGGSRSVARQQEQDAQCAPHAARSPPSQPRSNQRTLTIVRMSVAASLSV